MMDAGLFVGEAAGQVSADRFWLREASVDDTPVALAIIHRAFAEYQGVLDPPSGAPGETEQSLGGLFATERCLLAGIGPAALGCVFFHIRGNETYFHRLAVVPRQRGRGLGLALIAGVEAQAVRAGCQRVRLGVRLQLPENQALYGRLGYRVTGYHSHPGYTRPTYASMVRDVGEPAQRQLEVVPYDPEWPGRAAAEAKLLALACGDNLAAIHHIGSTAVPGLAAKPILDFLPVVYDLAAMDAAAATLEQLGFAALGEHGIPGRRYFRRWNRRRVSHVHIFAVGDPQIERHLAFRDYLRASPDKAARYADVKAEAAQRFPHDIAGYMAYKDGLIRQLVAEALAWVQARGG